jgi:hypothetical protein
MIITTITIIIIKFKRIIKRVNRTMGQGQAQLPRLA